VGLQALPGPKEILVHLDPVDNRVRQEPLGRQGLKELQDQLVR